MEAGSELDTPEAALDFSEVTWMSPSDNNAEFERLMAALNHNSSGVVSGDRLGTTWSEWR